MAESYYDLSSLPDLVLVKVFKSLPVSGRGCLASCNWRLRGLRDTPDVWSEVTLVLDKSTDMSGAENEDDASDFSETGGAVQTLCPRDYAMVQKYGKCFQKVTVVMNYAHIERRSLAVLTELCQRKVVNSVNLIYNLFSCQPRNPPPGEHDNTLAQQRMIAYEQHRSNVGTVEIPPTVGDFIDTLHPDAQISMNLPSQNCNTDKNMLKILCCDVRYPYFTRTFYNDPLSDKCCSLLKKLELSTFLTTEEFLATEGVLGTFARGNGQLPPPPPTAHLISRFPNLQELHVNISNLSDQLLLELSGALGRQKRPLSRLVIRHFSWAPTAFPQLSSAAWTQLANAIPSLTVECSVAVAHLHKLPPLSDVIKPETPLVKLDVFCISSEDQTVLTLYELGKSHRGTLQHFSFCVFQQLEANVVQEGLKSMVLACSRLQHLVCGTEIRDQILLDLAKDRQWRTFRFHPLLISTPELEDFNLCSESEMSEWNRSPLFPIHLAKVRDVQKAIEKTVGFLDMLDNSRFFTKNQLPQERHIQV